MKRRCRNCWFGGLEPVDAADAWNPGPNTRWRGTCALAGDRRRPREQTCGAWAADPGHAPRARDIALARAANRRAAD